MNNQLRVTRRQALQGMVAGAVAMSPPLLSSSPAKDVEKSCVNGKIVTLESPAAPRREFLRRKSHPMFSVWMFDIPMHVQLSLHWAHDELHYSDDPKLEFARSNPWEDRAVIEIEGKKDYDKLRCEDPGWELLRFHLFVLRTNITQRVWHAPPETAFAVSLVSSFVTAVQDDAKKHKEEYLTWKSFPAAKPCSA
jgi:hypothetical protein